MDFERRTLSVFSTLLGAVLVAFCAFAAVAPLQAQSVRLDEIAVSTGWLPGSDTRVTLQLSDAVPVSILTARAPDRIALDLPGVLPGDLPSPRGSGVVEAVRAGWVTPGTTRVLLTLAEPARVSKVARGDDGTLVVTLSPEQRSTFDARAAKDAARWPQPRGSAATVSGRSGLPLVMLDPGHGGVDPGAIREGLSEKDIALTFAREFAAALLDTDRYRVALTRDGDSYVSLRGRVAMAREARADVFLSLHANTVTMGSVQGAAVYTLSDTASDAEAAALAALENAADVFGGPEIAAESDVTRVLLDLARVQTDTRSRTLARAMVPALAETAGIVPRNPHKSAGFRVLKAPDIPSVLVELGFLSDAADRRRMQSPVWRA